MFSQLHKSLQINVLRKENGLHMVKKLKDLEWLILPDRKDHVFSKFTVFIKQKDPVLLPNVTRTAEIISFMKHMLENDIEVEETYIPLHIRFPNEFTDERYNSFNVNKTWMEAITLPCRPNLTEKELDQIIDAVKSYVPLSWKKRKVSVPVLSEKYKKYYKNYPMENMLQESAGYFKELHKIKVDLVEQYADKNTKILDIGCGPGLFTLELLEKGYQVDGLDIIEKYLDKLKERLVGKNFSYMTKTFHAGAADMAIIEDNSYDIVFSFSTLYHIEDQVSALNEIHRIIKPNGIAVLEFGNSDSLNYIATNMHESTYETPSFYYPLREIRNRIIEAGLDIKQHKCFQIFPYWNGHKFDSTITGILKGEMVKKRRGTMLDERVSSAFTVSKYAFRHIYVLEKLMYPLTCISSSCLPDIHYKKEWIKPERMKQRQEAVEQIKTNDSSAWAKGIGNLLDILEEDPSDLMTVYELIMLHKYDKYRDFAQLLKNDFPDPDDPFFRTSKKASANPDSFTREDAKKAAKISKERPTISIVLPTYNQEHWLPEIIGSSGEQTFQSFELIIVNDGSTDNTKKRLDSIDPMNFVIHNQDFDIRDKLRVIHQENKKLPGALNTGFKHTRGKYLTWVSSDCYCAPYMLEALKNALDKHPEAGMAYGDFMVMDENGHLIYRVSNPMYCRRSLLIRNDGNAAFMYRREVAEEIGEYDENLNGAEDWDYWIRISEKHPFVYVPEILYYYRLHSTSMQQSIPDEVNNSIVKMMTKTFGRISQIRVEELYPAIKECKNKNNALYVAAFDFGSSLLNARVLMPELAIMFLKKATEVNPDIPFGWINLAIAYAKQKRWREAENAISKVAGKIQGENLEEFISELTKQITFQSHSGINKLPVLNFSKIEVELFEREQVKRLICPFTVFQM
jgi:glycosyltransferase involved in cell wall biosynthesis/ubiquinone/menaquinone biosynthesis C-methylase UbiE